MEIIGCASPGYLKARGTPKAPEDLKSHDCLGFAGTTHEARWQFTGPDGKVWVNIKSRFSANGGQALRQAALAGVGIIFQPAVLTENDRKQGRLIQVLPRWPMDRPMHLLFAPDRRITPKLRSFIEFAVTRFG